MDRRSNRGYLDTMVSGGIEALRCTCPTVAVRVASRSAFVQEQTGRESQTLLRQHAELIDAAWTELCAANPRLHDGQILAVDSFDNPTGTFVVSPARYRYLAAQRYTLQAGPLAGVTVPDLGIRLLGVKAMITAMGSDGQEHVLILRRSSGVRVYGDMWEIGPGGGVELPHAPNTHSDTASNPAALTWHDLLASLAREAREELGVELDLQCDGPLLHGVYADHIAASHDVVLSYRWKATVDPKAGWCHIGQRDWEYSDAAWLAKADAASWATRGKQVSPLARVVLADWAGR